MVIPGVNTRQSSVHEKLVALVLLLMEEILHQVVGRLSHCDQEFIHFKSFARFRPSTVRLHQAWHRVPGWH